MTFFCYHVRIKGRSERQREAAANQQKQKKVTGGNAEAGGRAVDRPRKLKRMESLFAADYYIVRMDRGIVPRVAILAPCRHRELAI